MPVFGGFTSSVAKVERCIVVSGVPPSADEKVIYMHFGRCGSVTDVQLLRNRVDMVTGLALVEFLEDEAVTKACTLPASVNVVLGAALQTRRADAQAQQVNKSNTTTAGAAKRLQQPRQSLAHQVLTSVTRETGPHMRKLHIKNLRTVVTEEDMRGIFKPFGDFEAFQMGTQECWITFNSHTDAQDAMSSMQGFQLVGQELQITLQSVAPPITITTIISEKKPLAENMDLNTDSDFGATGTSSTPIQNRLEIMQKLMAARPQQPGLGHVLGLGTTPGPIGAPSATPPIAKPGGPTSRTLLLQNMYTPSSVDLKKDPKFYEDIREDTREECSKFGKVIQVTVDPRGQVGLIYVLFEAPQQRLSGELALNGRWFEGKKILATNIDDSIWQALAQASQASQA